MAAASMTGFGRAELTVAGVRLAVEIASVNQKNLQVSIHGPDAWPTLESLASPWVRARLQRGKVTARVTSASGAAARRLWDAEAVGASLDELAKIAARYHVPFQPDADLILRLAENGGRSGAALPDLTEVESIVRAAFDEALSGLVAMRTKEGDALAADLRQRLAALGKMVAGMAEAEKGAPMRHREALLRRLRDAGLQLDAGDERVLRELALFADRCDITEETVRLNSHLAQFGQELAQANCGRKLDFLVQELLREVNTIGSKASEIATTKLVLEAKTEIERIREQVQNLE